MSPGQLFDSVVGGVSHPPPLPRTQPLSSPVFHAPAPVGWPTPVTSFHLKRMCRNAVSVQVQSTCSQRAINSSSDVSSCGRSTQEVNISRSFLPSLPARAQNVVGDEHLSAV